MWRRILKYSGALAGIAVLAATLAGCVYKYQPRTFALPPPVTLPAVFMEDGTIALRAPGSRLVGLLANYDDELFAYLMFDYLRGQPGFQEREVLLSYARRGGTLVYSIYVLLPDDVFAAGDALTGLARPFPFLTPEWFFADPRAVEDLRSRTQTFTAAYNFPGYRELERLSKAEVLNYARRFIRLKSNTDPRIRRQIAPVPQALTPAEAEQLAEDIVTVAGFYDLPLDFFLGIGAMENNYMNVAGDLGRGIWKRRAEKGDVVLRKRGNRVLVLNESSGVWQITRETLRVAHRLYLKDERDYSQLPEGLRPPQDLDVAAVEPRVLTTYAALLFRDLLDRFEGDVGKAVGAYNGGPGNPNPVYAAGVGAAAAQARRVMEQASALRGQKIVGMVFLRPGPHRADPPPAPEPGPAAKVLSAIQTFLNAE